MVFLQKPVYSQDEVSQDETDLSKITDNGFWTHKENTHTADIFDTLNKLVVNDNTGLNLFVNKQFRDNDICRLDFAFRRTVGQRVRLNNHQISCCFV